MYPRKVDLILKSITQLRPMPATISRVLKAAEDPTTTAGVLSDLIGLDQALSALVLQVANSAAMGFGRNCATLTDAVMRLGFKRIRSLAMGCASNGPLTKRLNGYRLGAGELWNHSLAVAVAGEWVARAVHYPEPEQAYIAGLLHDMGKLFLDQYILTDYSRMTELIVQYRMSLPEVENQLLGIDHAAVGALMAEKWQFPALLGDAIHYHHSPSFARAKPELSAVVNIANAFVNRQHPNSFDMYSQVVHPEAIAILRLKENDLERMEKGIQQYLSNGAA